MDWSVGDFAMHRGGPCRLVAKLEGCDAYRVELVSNYERGVGICCGGGCFPIWPNDLTPITDPEVWLLCEAYRSLKEVEAARKAIVEHEARFEAHKAALLAISAARAALSPAEGREPGQ